MYLANSRCGVPIVCLAAAMLCGALGSAGAQGLGCEPSPPQAFENHAHVRIAARRGIDRPKTFSLAEYLPPVGDQGVTSACVGWSTAYYCYSSAIARQRKLSPEQKKDPRFLFSPAFIWHQHNNGDLEKGMHIYQAFDILAKQGCASLADMPWKEKDAVSQADDATKARALRYKARQTVSLFKGKLLGEAGDADKLKNWLWETKQPFVVGIPVFADFFKLSHDADFVYMPSDPAAKREGFHAVCIVGYDETKNAFLMVNSWTEAWGNKGFAWLDAEFVAQQAIEGWGQRPGGPIARATVPVQITPSIVLEPAANAQ